MNWDQVEGKWKQVKGSIRERWGKMTDDDLEIIAGNRDRFVGKLQERYGLAREDAQKKADEWAKTLRETEGAHTAAEHPTPKTYTGKP
jgi:uncharacterized protein YjbJ (UPF0337 family)